MVLIFTALSIVALLLTFCRGAIVGTAISALLLAYLYKEKSGIENHNIRKYKLLLLVLSVILIAVICYSNIATDGKTVHEISILISRGLSERIPLWTGAIDTIIKNPINGVGLGNYVLPSKINAHNELLQMGAEAGIIGIFGLLLFSTILYRHISRSFSLDKKPKVKILHIALISGCIATIIHSIVSYNLHSSTSSYFFFMGLGILCSNAKLAISRHPLSRGKIVSCTVALCLVSILSLGLAQVEYNGLAGHYSFNKAQIFLTKNDLIKSSHYASKATHYQPENAEYHILASRIYLKSKNVELAEEHYQQAEILMKRAKEK